MTRFHFIFDNKVQRDILHECGVKNVSVNYKTVKKEQQLFANIFDNIILHSGSGAKNFTSEEYNDFIKQNLDIFKTYIQYDEPGETKRTMSYYHQALEQGLENIIPILCEDYLVHLNYLKPILKSNIIALGKGRDIDSEDKDYEQLIGGYTIHGLSKARWLNFNTPPASVDSTTWLNGVKNGKLQVKLKDGFTEISIRDIRVIGEAMEENKDFVDRCNLKISQLAAKDHKAFLKASLCLNYMPHLKDLEMFEENFN